MQEEELITRYIEMPPPLRGVGYTHLKDSGVSVWAIISYMEQAAHGDMLRVAHDYDVPVDAVKAAIAFYRRHPDAIDARILANSADDPQRHAA